MIPGKDFTSEQSRENDVSGETGGSPGTESDRFLKLDGPSRPAGRCASPFIAGAMSSETLGRMIQARMPSSL
jgi:hypothetical protein